MSLTVFFEPQPQDASRKRRVFTCSAQLRDHHLLEDLWVRWPAWDRGDFKCEIQQSFSNIGANSWRVSKPCVRKGALLSTSGTERKGYGAREQRWNRNLTTKRSRSQPLASPLDLPLGHLGRKLSAGQTTLEQFQPGITAPSHSPASHITSVLTYLGLRRRNVVVHARRARSPSLRRADSVCLMTQRMMMKSTRLSPGPPGHT